MKKHTGDSKLVLCLQSTKACNLKRGRIHGGEDAIDADQSLKNAYVVKENLQRIESVPSIVSQNGGEMFQHNDVDIASNRESSARTQ